jgi:hypothetical protein
VIQVPKTTRTSKQVQCSPVPVQTGSGADLFQCRPVPVQTGNLSPVCTGPGLQLDQLDWRPVRTCSSPDRTTNTQISCKAGGGPGRRSFGAPRCKRSPRAQTWFSHRGQPCQPNRQRSFGRRSPNNATSSKTTTHAQSQR